MVIRNAKLSDAYRLRELISQLGYPDFSEKDAAEKIEKHNQPSYRLLVVEEASNVIAFASLHWFEMVHRKGFIGRITGFCVDESFRSRGVGQELLKACEASLKKEGCNRLEVTSNKKRARAHQFYMKAGYLDDSLRFVKNQGF